MLLLLESALFCFFPHFFARSLASQSRFHSFLLARFQVKGVSLNFFNNIFLLHLALKPPQSVFEGFSPLAVEFLPMKYTPKPVRWDAISYYKLFTRSQGGVQKKLSVVVVKKLNRLGG